MVEKVMAGAGVVLFVFWLWYVVRKKPDDQTLDKDET